MVRLLKHLINSDDRQFYIEKVNRPLFKAIVFLSKRYPQPTMENLSHHNSKWLLRRLEKYLEYEGNPRVAEVVTALVRIAIAKIDHSPNWRDRVSWWIEDTEGWKPRSYNHPVNLWNEPKPYGKSLSENSLKRRGQGGVSYGR